MATRAIRPRTALPRSRPILEPTRRVDCDARLEPVRRIDWRFLLPDPEPRRVALLPSDSASQCEALRGEIAYLTELSEDPKPDPQAAFDLVVASRATDATLERARRLLRPGGWLYVEGRRGTGSSPPELARALAGNGFQDARSHWHWPNHENALEIVPLDAPSALSLALRRRRGGSAALVKGWLGRGLVGSGAFPRLAPAWSVMARRLGASSGLTQNPALAFLELHAERLGLARLGLEGPLTSVLVTPRFRASSHVVHLVLGAAGPDPKLVVKLPRLAGGDSFVRREAANLEAVARSAREPGSIPRLVALEPHAGRTLLVQSAVEGDVLERSRVRRDPERWCAAALTWLLPLAQGGEPRWLGPEDLARLVTAPLARLEASAEFSQAERSALARTRNLVEQLRGRRLPATFEHGDFSPPNVLRQPFGRLGVLDWEGAEPIGMPGSDFFFFLGYVAFARENAASTDACLHAFHSAFFGAEAWARPWVQRYAQALGLEAQSLGPLLVLCWARTLARLVDRILGAGEGRLSGATLEWLRGNRYYALWRDSLVHVEQIQSSTQPCGARA
jgi:aminoglycoside phosphotransferase (APT) family kinase protein